MTHLKFQRHPPTGNQLCQPAELPLIVQFVIVMDRGVKSNVSIAIAECQQPQTLPRQSEPSALTKLPLMVELPIISEPTFHIPPPYPPEESSRAA